jgi:phosphocarrier protein
MATATDTVTVRHEAGLHARPASKFVQTASNFDADITVRTSDGGESGDAKSSLGVMSLGVGAGEEIVVEADGHDASEAVARLVSLVENDFELDE